MADDILGGLKPMRHFNPMQFSGHGGAAVGATSRIGGRARPKAGGFGLAIPPMGFNPSNVGATSQFRGAGSTSFPGASSGPSANPSLTYSTNAMHSFPPHVPLNSPKGKQTVPSKFSAVKNPPGKFKAPGKMVRVPASKYAGANQKNLEALSGGG